MSTDTTISLAISGMSCGHCVAAVRRAVSGVPGVADAQVAIGSATLRLDEGADPVAVRAAAARAVNDEGYGVDDAPALVSPMRRR